MLENTTSIVEISQALLESRPSFGQKYGHALLESMAKHCWKVWPSIAGKYGQALLENTPSIVETPQALWKHPKHCGNTPSIVGIPQALWKYLSIVNISKYCCKLSETLLDIGPS